MDNFILVKNKYKLSKATATVYAIFLEHLKDIDKNIVVDDAFKIIKLALDSKEIGTADRQEFIANPKEGLKAAYEKYNFNYNKKLALQFINSKNEKKSEVQKNKIAAEMANPAYSVIKAMEYRFQAATKIFADSKDKGNKTDQSMNQLRPSIIEEYKNIESNEARINDQRDKGIDANGNYDPSLDKNYYQQF